MKLGSDARFSTICIHAGQTPDPSTGAIITPIFQTSTYEQEAPGVNRGFDYSRTNNPTRARLEAVLAELEGVEHAAVYGSGLAWAHFTNRALRTGELVIPKASPTSLEVSAIADAVEIYRGEI